jgi:hypothetical protein
VLRGGHSHFINCVAFAPDATGVPGHAGGGRAPATAAVTTAKSVLRLNVNRSGPPGFGRSSGGGGEEGEALPAVGSGLLASASTDESIRLFDLARPGAPPAVLRGHAGPVYAVAWLRGGGPLVSGAADDSIRLWAAS